MTLRVPGMDCPKCEERIALALGRLPGIILVRADHVREEIELQLVRAHAPLAEVRRRIEALGFRVEAVSPPSGVTDGCMDHDVDWRDSAPLYRQIVEGTPDAIIVADGAGAIRYWNAGAEAICGYRASDASGRRSHQAYHSCG